MHLAPTASKRIYQQRVGRVTRRHPGKEAGLVVDFVHPATKHDDPVVTLHSLLDRDVYRGGAIVVGPVRRGRGRRMRVERRVLPVCAEEERRFAVFERELWRIAVEHLDYGEQHVWAALAGARVTPNGWRRARAMLHFDRTGELKSRYLITAVQRNPSPQLRLRALADIAAGRDADAFDTAIDVVGSWPREERREASKIMLRALVERRIGRRDQASAWIWRLAEYTRELHEEYAVQRWPETKRLLGLLVNSSGGAHARNARRLIHASRKQDRRLAAALLAAALAHTPEAEEALRGARTRMARKPPALARELLRNFPKRRTRNNKRRRKGPRGAAAPGVVASKSGASKVAAPQSAAQAGEARADERKAAAVQAVKAQAAAVRAVEAQAAVVRPVEAQVAAVRPVDARAVEVRPVEAQAVEVQPAKAQVPEVSRPAKKTSASGTPNRKPATRKSAPRKPTGTKTSPRKAPTTKAAARKATATEAIANEAMARSATATKATARKATGNEATARKAAATKAAVDKAMATKAAAGKGAASKATASKAPTGGADTES